MRLPLLTGALVIVLTLEVVPLSGGQLPASFPVSVHSLAVASPAAPATGQTLLSDRPSGSWRRVTSANFTAVGDAPESALRDALLELEVFRSAIVGLSDVLPAPRFRAVSPRMILFRSDAAFGQYKPRDVNGRRRDNVGGYYFSDTVGAHMVTAIEGGHMGERLGIVLHEYAHDLFHFTLGNDLPPWLNEGLAELCGSVGSGGDSRLPGRYLGRPIDWHVFSLRQTAGPSIVDVLNVDGLGLSQMNPDNTGRFYSKSWALVHYLMLGRDDRRPGDVPAYLAAVHSGQSHADAFQQAFRVDMATIDSVLSRYIQRVSFPAIRINVPTVSAETMKTEPMLESEVEQLQGYLLLSAGDRPEAEKRLSSAFARNPNSSATRLSLARYHLTEFRPEQAIEVIQPVVEAEPRMYAARIELGLALQRTGRYMEAFEAFRLATTLPPTTTGADAWYGLSLAASSLERNGDADDAMVRLQAIDPSSSWYSSRARELWKAGRYERAVADAQTRLGSAGSDPNDPAYAAFIGALSARRLGQSQVADALLARVNSAKLAPWTRTVLTYLRGDLPDREFLSKADGRGEETEARAYIGLSASIAGRHSEAVQHLTWVRDRGARTYTEYDMSRVELARLTSAPGNN